VTHNLKALTILSFTLLLAACSAPKGESWPTVSFGAEIQAINDARITPSEITLAPLPALSEEDRAGLENREEFLKRIESDLADIARTLGERKADYSVARAGLDLVSGNDYRDTWLVAQMELSNISQATEALKVIRAQVMALGTPWATEADVLLKKAEALELENRIFGAREKAYISTRAPS